jgi:hypothetical protein
MFKIFPCTKAFRKEMSPKHKHIREKHSGHFPSQRILLESSTSIVDWQTLNDKFASSIRQFEN